MSNESQYSEDELIITSTHSIKESKGSAMGLEGNQALYIVGAAVASFIIVFIGVINHWSPMVIVMAFIIPFCLAYLYLYIFHINKTPGYQSDMISKAINGSDYDIRTSEHKQNPFLELKTKMKSNG
jgi:hypothetical protein